MSIKEEDRWDKIFRRLTRDLTPKQALLYKIIFETTRDMVICLPTSYVEVVIRSILKIYRHEKRLEKKHSTWA